MKKGIRATKRNKVDLKEAQPTVGACQPVFKSQKECDKFFNDFRESVASDLDDLRMARIEGERNIRREILWL